MVDTRDTMYLPLHFGQLHAWEQAIVILVAFGPFLLLGVIVLLIRRRDIAEEEREASGRGFPEERPGDDTPG